MRYKYTYNSNYYSSCILSDIGLARAETINYINECYKNNYCLHYFVTMTQDRGLHCSDGSRLINQGRFIANKILSQIHNNLKRCKNKRPAIYIGFIENEPSRKMSYKNRYLTGDDFWHVHMIISVHSIYEKKARIKITDCLDYDDSFSPNNNIRRAWEKLHPRGTIQIKEFGNNINNIRQIINYSSKSMILGWKADKYNLGHPLVFSYT